MVTDQEHSIALAAVDAIPEDGGFEWRADPQGLVSVVLFRRAGRIYAYRNSCPHQGRPLGLGRGGGDGPQRFFMDKQQRLVCPHHGAVFQVEDGECVSGPCRGAGLRPVAIRVAAGQVYLDQTLE